MMKAKVCSNTVLRFPTATRISRFSRFHGVRPADMLGACLFAVCLLFLSGTVPAEASADDHNASPFPAMTVVGRGEAAATPDQAVVQAGATVQSEEAAPAQRRVNQIIQDALKAIKAQKIPKTAIKTARLSLSPVYTPQTAARKEQKIIGYRANQTLRIELDDLDKSGAVIDACVKAGANQIEGVTFRLKNDIGPRLQALKAAVDEARAKAKVIAETSGLKLDGINEIVEGGVQPRMEPGRARMAAADVTPTPVEPGQVRIEALVTVHYRISDAGK